MPTHTGHFLWQHIQSIPTVAQFVRAACVAALISAAPAQASTVSFFLDQSNQLPDNINYLSVALTESESGVDILVKTLDPLNSIAGKHFGIQKFAFSFANDTSYAISGLPDYWTVKTDKRMDGFGKFDVRLQGKGKARTDELSFTVTGVNLGDFNSLFAAHVAGFEWCPPEREEYRWCGKDGKDCLTSAYFAGSTPATPVPIPAAMWLFGSGLISLAAMTRRKKPDGAPSVGRDKTAEVLTTEDLT